MIKSSLGRSIVFAIAALVSGCADSEDQGKEYAEPQGAEAGAEPAAALGQVEQLVVDACSQDCTRAYIACTRECALDPGGGGDCGCHDQLQSCRLSCPNGDVDLDGVLNGVDNCPANANANQANCDGDWQGDACDPLNANYQPVGGERTCMTDRDAHFAYFTFEHHVERMQRDVSTCGAPDRWTNRIARDNDCVGISDEDCCMGLRHSIAALGDDPFYWCSATIRDRNFCR